MDCAKVGSLILQLRKEKGYTQKKLAECMNLSDKTISKWERGLGCPDVSLLQELADALGVPIEQILSGELDENELSGGNMKRIRFYRCPSCGNIMTTTADAEISCCGRKQVPMNIQPMDEDHRIQIETLDDEFYISFSHEMTKEHYLVFLAYVTCDQVFLKKFYPEQGNELHIPRMRGGCFYVCCSQHGLWRVK
ncbi:helix-turn-helix domain-containing protein [Anaerosporobacter faecicola]|uniref:helix-turn-helix domain-containing protein n=1 Tax=Anaerosporobacter faecicola TaxID=2718714 RepID=UPI00143C9F78|nr:helix-turn-helix domain-containing protein [Anaerosporobacter faecicola]